MPQFRIVPTRQILIEGQIVSPADVLATIDVCCDLPVDRILNLVEYRNALLIPSEHVVAVSDAGEEPTDGGEDEDGLAEDVGDDAEDAAEDVDGEEPNPFAESGEFTDAQLASLEAAGVTSISSGRRFLEQNGGSFIELDEIGRKTDEKLRAIVAR